MDGTNLLSAFTRQRQIEDRYLSGTRLRLRRVTERACAPVYKLGKKYEPTGTGMHSVVSTYLTEAEYSLLAELPARTATKTRFTVAGGALDVYMHPNPGLQVFEVEFTSAIEAAEYTPPSGVGQEITHDPAFSGYALAGAA